MSLDELMDLAAEPRSDTATMPIPASLPTTPAAPRPLNPAAVRPAPAPTPRTTPKPVPTGPDLRERVLTDARRAYDAALERGRIWLKQGDHGLIAATGVVLLLLLVVVAAV
jgi:hypothetical protein